MKEHKRWGKKFIDKRDWPKYNEELVVRGEFLIDCEWAKSWNAELAEMNKGKVGAKYEYPGSLIRLQAVWHQWIDYRGIEGVTRKLAEFGKLPACNDYSTANRRVNGMDVKFELPFKDCCVSTDGSGMKFENAGEYRARMYGKKREKYIKVVISADPIRKKMLDCDVSIEGEGMSEPEVATAHMQELMLKGIDVKKFFGDGSYDTLDIFAFLEHNDIEPAVKPRKNAAGRRRVAARQGGCGIQEERLQKMGAAQRLRDAVVGHGRHLLGSQAQIRRTNTLAQDRKRLQ